MPSKGSEPGFMRITQFSTYFKEKKTNKKKLYFSLLIVPVHDFSVLLFTKKSTFNTSAHQMWGQPSPQTTSKSPIPAGSPTM